MTDTGSAGKTLLAAALLLLAAPCWAAPPSLEKRVEELERKVEAIKAAAPAEAINEPKTDEVKFPDLKKAGIPDYITKGFYFSGYFRAGAGVNHKGGKMEAFQAPDAPAKYRLGNEQETYLEAVFNEKNWNSDQGGVTFLTQLRLAFTTQQNQSADTGISNSAPPSSVAAVKADKVLLREIYAEMGNFVSGAPEVKVWGGQRFYRLPELEINDFWWSDMSGYGGGFEDIGIQDIGRLDVAYIGYASNDLDQRTSHGRTYKNNLHVMLKDVAVPLGAGTFWVNGGYMSGGATSGAPSPDLGGADVGLMHVVPERNQLGLQFGFGSNSSLSAAANIPPSDDDRKAWTFRFTDMYNHAFSERASLQLVGVFQYTHEGRSSPSRLLWASFGARPVLGLTKHLALEVEPGLDYVSHPQRGTESALFKFTTALRLSPGTRFDSRPRFRLFATYAAWGNGFKNQNIGGPGFNSQRYGVNLGLQCEHWW